jgi:hypothetical protein
MASSRERRPPSRLYLDDHRPAPDGWLPLRTPEDFRYLVSRYRWASISLDNDLSGQYTDVTGEDLLNWMFDEGFLPEKTPSVHSQDPEAAPRMRDYI